jgi:hypothetical protein
MYRIDVNVIGHVMMLVLLHFDHFRFGVPLSLPTKPHDIHTSMNDAQLTNCLV